MKSESRAFHGDIRIGTQAPISMGLAYLESLIPWGFETVQINAWMHLGEVELSEYSKRVLDVCGDQVAVSSVAVYGNPFTDEQTRADLARAIESAPDFGCDLVCGFTGAFDHQSVPNQIETLVEVWTPLVKLARDKGVRIAFENCDMGGTWDRPSWNLAHSPAAWELIFNALDPMVVGLEWEPCHQIVSLVDPLQNLRRYVSHVFHLHGKDASLDRHLLSTAGIRGGAAYVHHRTPGFGDTNWTDLISILRLAGYRGAIDIEGWHDPVYRDELELTGQVHALRYLKICRGGEYVELA